MEYVNGPTLISFPIGNERIEASYMTKDDDGNRVYRVVESNDGGKTWATIREYDSKNWKIIA